MASPTPVRVLVAGATGYLGRALIPRLLARGHEVTGLVRAGSEKKLPAGCSPVLGDALDLKSISRALAPGETLVQLVGTPRPAPWKAEEFRRVDLVSGLAAVGAAQSSRAGQLVYVSVAQPARTMRAYVEVRAQVERAIRDAGLRATIVRPWYVLGPGHRWPVALVPVYWILERIPATRESARRLGLVTLEQMVAALVWAVEHPASDLRILDVPRIRAGPMSAKNP